MPEAKPNCNGIMSKEDKVKLNGIASGANNYTLPAASETTLGGIKVSGSIGNTDHSKYWPIYVDSNGVVRTIITGLNRTRDGNIRSIKVQDLEAYAKYGVSNIEINDGYGEISNVTLPSRSGTLAVLGDIPNVSNLCRFNFINSISECKSDRINFLLGFTGNIDITPLFSCNNGTILFMVTSDNVANIGITSGNWSLNMEDYDHYASVDVYKGKLCLATVYNSKIFFFRL